LTSASADHLSPSRWRCCLLHAKHIKLWRLDRGARPRVVMHQLATVGSGYRPTSAVRQKDPFVHTRLGQYSSITTNYVRTLVVCSTEG
jgi:hypothetical protein